MPEGRRATRRKCRGLTEMGVVEMLGELLEGRSWEGDDQKKEM